MISHGKKLNQFGACHLGIQEFMLNSGLKPLCDISYDYVNKVLILAFVERWPKETNTFHLPIGETTITLDDVSCLLHLPIVGEFCPNEPLDYDGALKTVITLMRVE